MVLNYNGGAHVQRCLSSLARTEWPSEALEIVVVDNASTDRSDDEIEERHPEVRLVRAGSNLGFPGNNLAMGDLTHVDYLALVNNDAFVEPGWLAPLVDALESDRSVGAACPKILFEPGFVDVTIRSSVFHPGRGDTRGLGVRVSAVEVDGIDAWRRAQFVAGFWGVEHAPEPETTFQWTDGDARMRVPVDPGKPATGELLVRLASPRRTQVTLACEGYETEVTVDEEPRTFGVSLGGRPYDVVNNAGSILVEGGYGADRGFLEPDSGQFDAPAEVFSWCGGGVLLSGEYLRDAGLFDERFFLYYEDTDLSWRGRARGWRHQYVPESTIRHLHAATSVEGSALFTHFVERNRLLMLWKNAPLSMALWAVAHFVLVTGSYARRDIVAPVLRGHRPNPALVRRRWRALLAFVALLPRTLGERRRLRRRQLVPDAELLAWMVPQP